MSESIPCPACGTPSEPGSESCALCGFAFSRPGSGDKCSRCGSPLGEDFAFCQVCGLGVGQRLARPETQRLKVVTTEIRRLRSQRAPSEPEIDAPAPPARTPTPWDITDAPAHAPPPAAPPAAVAESHPFAGFGASPLRLVLVNRDGSDGQSFFFPDSTLTLGRHGGDLFFEHDEFLSPLHARIEVRGDGLWLVDLGSVNGAFIRIQDSEPVFPGDSFLIGHQLLRLDNAPETPPEVGDEEVRIFGTPLDPAWARLTRIGYGGVEAERYLLRAAIVVFGREQGDIVFGDDAFISRQHAQLAVTVQGTTMTVTLSDLRSANGTYLRIRGEAPLAIGASFRVGDQIFRVRAD